MSSKIMSSKILKNPRLKLRGNSANASDESTPLTDDEYIIHRLSEVNIALSPHQILDFVVIVIKRYIGANLTVNMHQNSRLLDEQSQSKSGGMLLTANGVVGSQPLSLPMSINQYHALSRIGLIMPIVYRSASPSLSPDNILAARDAIAVLQGRNTRATAADLGKGILYPYVLDHSRYEWKVWPHTYISTVYKDYMFTLRTKHQFYRIFLAPFCGKTLNVHRCVIMCDIDSHTNLCIFNTANGIFYTDPRMIHQYTNKSEANKEYAMKLALRIPLLTAFDDSIDRDLKIAQHIWTQQNQEVYVWNSAKDILYRLHYEGRSAQSDAAFDLTLRANDALVKRDDAELPSADTLNTQLRAHSLLRAQQLIRFDPKKVIFSHAQNSWDALQCMYYQDDVGVYVAAIYWVELKPTGDWTFGAMACNNLFVTFYQKAWQQKFRAKERKFYNDMSEKKDTFCIAFVDERDAADKRLVILQQKYCVTVPLLKKSEVDGDDESRAIAQCVDIASVAPDSMLVKGQIRFQPDSQWFYNSGNATLYIFERMPAKSAYPHRMHEIALNAFTFST